MKKIFSFVLFAMTMALVLPAQEKKFDFKFYGRLRADLFYNSRANNETIDGIFYLYPKDHNYDSEGKDLNGGAQGNMYIITSRLGVDIKGPDLGSAKTSAKVEADFRGSGSTFCVFRVRQCYVNLDWGKYKLLIGQTWHPLFGEVAPSTLNLCTGAPFQMFNRSPMLRFRYQPSAAVTTTLAAIWQIQYNNAGPNGKSHDYIKNGCLPEIFLGVDYKKDGWIAGAGAELLSIMPRRNAEYNGQTYRVDERVTSLSVEAHAKYVADNWQVSAKTALANNLTQCTTLGGFAVTSIDQKTGKCEYTPFRHSLSWFNIVYGKKWQPGFFIGYLKNLGTGKPIAGNIYGVGLDVDQLLATYFQFSYNLPHWRFGVEFSPSTAWYGSTDKKTGKVVNTHTVTNYRVLATMMYTF